MAKNETSFKKGNSGNPGGRPKGAKGFRQACRDLTPVALEALEDIITSKSNPQARTAAARVIIEHGYGRAIQTIENIDTQKDAGAALAAVRLALYGPEGEKAGKRPPMSSLPNWPRPVCHLLKTRRSRSSTKKKRSHAKEAKQRRGGRECWRVVGEC